MSTNRDPVEFWLSRISPVTRQGYLSSFSAFSRFAGLTGEQMIEKRKAGDGYDLLDMLQGYVSKLDLSFGTKLGRYNVVRSFFIHNRCALPADRSFNIQSGRPTVTPKLTLEHVRKLVMNAGIRDRSIMLVKWMTMVDTARLTYINARCCDEIVEQLRDKVHPVRVNLAGRKKNRHGYYTFIGKDACDALVEYFEKERGWPKNGEGIWVGVRGSLDLMGFRAVWARMTQRLGLIPQNGRKKGARYGFGAHEMRDIAKSLLHTKAKSDGFDMDCCEFWLGHTVDKLGYDKFFLDQEYVRKQYLIAEKYLNIISNPAESETVKEQSERLQVMEQKIKRLSEILEAQVESKT